MLTKEYRIPLPLTVDEYRIAQLYMIQKKSRNESSGKQSGVEIIKNEPYSGGPGGNGQYTFKVYHVGSHLPGWFRAILPKSALRVEEEAWNAYPYTRTIYRCPFVEKFKIDIETVYLPDAGTTDNVFDLATAELRTRIVDLINFVSDQPPSSDYHEDEDPIIYCSQRTGRGPLESNWLKQRSQGLGAGTDAGPVMCAYKLCRVEFKYWGMQSKIEKFIHDTALRRTMLRAHRQAWAWQDEWYGLSLTDIRNLEAETQRALAEKMAASSQDPLAPDDEEDDGSDVALSPQRAQGHCNSGSNSAQDSPRQQPPVAGTAFASSSDEAASAAAPTTSGHVAVAITPKLSSGSLFKQSSRGNSRERISRVSTVGSRSSKISWQSMENVDDASSGDEYYDAEETLIETQPPIMYSIKEEHDSRDVTGANHIGPQTDGKAGQPPVCQLSQPDFVNQKTAMLFLVLHGGTMLQGEADRNSVMSDISTLKNTFDSIIRSHYPSLIGRYVLKLVACPSFHLDALNMLASVSPRTGTAAVNLSLSGAGASQGSAVSQSEFFPISAVPLLATSSPAYGRALQTTASRANKAFLDFRLSDEGRGFCGQVCLIGDSVGALLGFDILSAAKDDGSGDRLTSADSLKRCSSDSHLGDEPGDHQNESDSQCSVSYPTHKLARNLSSPVPNIQLPRQSGTDLKDIRQSNSRTCSVTSTASGSLPPAPAAVSLPLFEFDVSDFFMLGSPIAEILAHRLIMLGKGGLQRPVCSQLYNLYHCSDPSAGRLEPLLDELFIDIDSVKIARYQRYPLGDGLSTSLLDTMQKIGKFASPSDGHFALSRKESNGSYASATSLDANIEYVAALARRWWGMKRLDYSLYCPEALEMFPTNSLPALFHASYWESTDVASFILRQLVQGEDVEPSGGENERVPKFLPSNPREKWLQTRSAIKTKNIAPNHRGNDCIVLEGQPQMLAARFMYGPLDMVTLSGEMVDVHIVKDTAQGEWIYMGSQMTDRYGRVSHQLPEGEQLPIGMYPVKMVVRGDHTFADLYLMVLPPNAGCVVFSIDGSFTASMSLMANNPKVRPGSVDVVRHWQDLGYIIVYVSARPDMQLRKMVGWLAQHNFPHGMVAFMDGLSADPLRQKACYLRTLLQETQLNVCAAYGSQKDISVYQAVGLPQEKIFAIGKVSKKVGGFAQVLSTGYAVHLQDLLSGPTRPRPCKSNARIFLQKSCFSLPAQRRKSYIRHKSATSSAASCGSGSDGHAGSSAGGSSDRERAAITVSQLGTTVIDAAAEGGLGTAAPPRGRSPHQRVPPPPAGAIVAATAAATAVATATSSGVGGGSMDRDVPASTRGSLSASTTV